MGPANKMEKKFFKNVKNRSQKSNFLQLNNSYLPTKFIGKLNRFYLDKDSIWISRLKISRTEKIYYLGLEKNIPTAIITFNNQSYKSCIKFVNEKVAILIKIEDNEVYNKINQLFTLKYATNDKSSGYYYIILGNIDSKDLFKNIKTLIRRFIFKIELDKNELNIIEVPFPPSSRYSSKSLSNFKSNGISITSWFSISSANLSMPFFKKLIKFFFFPLTFKTPSHQLGIIITNF